MKDNFVHLHTHSSFSFTDGYGLPEQYIKRAVEIGQPAIGVTDHGNISSHYKWYKQCNKSEIKPILGIEFYIVENEAGLAERRYYHITVLVKNNVGYKNLTTLVTKSWCEQFYYKPRITFKDLFEYQKGLIVLSGCLSSPIMKKLADGDIKGADAMIELFSSKCDDFYIEVQPVSFEDGLPAYKRLLKLYTEKWKDKGAKIVATNDCHYVCKDQCKIQEILLCVQTNDKMDRPTKEPTGDGMPPRWKFDQEDFYLKTRKEMEESLQILHPNFDFTESLDATIKIADMVNFVFPTAAPIKFPIEDSLKIDHLKNLCNEGMIKRGLVGDQKYRERLDYEIDLIVKKDFVDYFLVIADLIQWSKEQKILVGPARGSAAGSLACYVLEITEVEPIRWGLIFERFIDLNREDLPDIDIDFEDVRRHEAKEYLERKYGKNKVGNLPTFTTFKGKSAIDDIGRSFRIPFSVLDKVKNAIIERSGGDSRASFTLEDTFTSDVFEYPKIAMKEYPVLQYAIELEGQLRQIGQHAAGVVISNEPLTDFCAIYKIRDQQVISMDYKDCTDTGLLKIDILGLNTLSVISFACRMIKERHNKDIDVYQLKLDDPKVYNWFCKGKLFGIFQFDGQAVNQVCRQILPKDFESLSAISALARPGPLNSGNTTKYISRRNGKEKIKHIHKIMEGITRDSYGIVIYQEQVMRVMREIGKMSWKETSDIRKNMSRSTGVEKFNTFRDKFIPGALENGLTQKQADGIWEEMCSYGSWAFNKSHSVSYTIISYWTMWLKVHYPMEFYSSILALTGSEEKKKKILKEYLREGFKILPIDINRSKEHFSIDGDYLRIGFEDISGIGDSKSGRIVKKQPYSSYSDFTKKSKLTKTTLKYLVDLGAFDIFGNGVEQINLFGEEVPEFVKEPMSIETRLKVCPWDVDFGIERNWLPFIKDNISYFRKEPISIESLKESEGPEDVIIYGVISDKNLRDAREVSMSRGKDFDKNKYKIVHFLNKECIKDFRGNEWTSQGELKKYHDKGGKTLKEGVDYAIEEQFQFANFVVEDDTDFITVRLSQVMFPMYGKLLFEKVGAGDPVVIKGKMGSGIRMFFANKIVSLKHYKKDMELRKKIA